MENNLNFYKKVGIVGGACLGVALAYQQQSQSNSIIRTPKEKDNDTNKTKSDQINFLMLLKEVVLRCYERINEGMQELERIKVESLQNGSLELYKRQVELFSCNFEIFIEKTESSLCDYQNLKKDEYKKQTLENKECVQIRKMLLKWIEDVKLEKYPDFPSIVDQIPKKLDEDMFVRMMDKLSVETLKREYLELRMIGMQDDSLSLNEASSRILEMIQINAAHWFKNIYNLVYNEDQGEDAPNIDLLAVRSLQQLIEKYYYSKPSVDEKLNKLTLLNDQKQSEMYKDSKQPISSIGIKYEPHSIKLYKNLESYLNVNYEDIIESNQGFALKGQQMSSNKVTTLNMQLENIGQAQWEGSSVLFGQEQSAKLEVVEDSSSLDQEVIIEQTNCANEKLTQKLQGDLRQGCIYGKWQDDTFKTDTFFAMVFPLDH